MVSRDLDCGLSDFGSPCEGYLGVGANCVDNCQEFWVLARFDIDGAIPAYSTIHSATLNLNVNADPPHDVPIDAYPITTPWNVNATAWTTDGTTPWPSPYYDTTTTDVTTMVRRWVSAERANYGVAFLPAEVGSEWNRIEEISPTLTVNYTPPPPGWVDGEPPSEDVGDANAADPDPVPENDPSNDPAVGELVPEPDEPPAVLEPVGDDDQRRGPEDEGRWKVRVANGWVTVRNKIQQFYIGALHDDWTIDVVFGDRNYLWGWGHGQYDYCGYINGNNVRNREEFETNHCRNYDWISPSRIAGVINCDDCTGGTGVEIIRDVVAYRNVRALGGSGQPYAQQRRHALQAGAARRLRAT